MRYLAPLRIEDALGLLAGGNVKILAGGTDFYPALRDRQVASDTIDISRIAGLRGIARRSGGWRIGATTTWTDLVRADLPPAFDGLKAAAREIGAVQIQNAGTIVGNICNASPAADGVPPLLTLDASVEIASSGATREMPLAAFITGVRKTALGPGEMVVALTLPDIAGDAVSAFAKLGSRSSLVISIAMIAAVLVRDSAGKIAEARVAVGSCSPVARRIPALEQALKGAPFTPAELAARVSPAHFSVLAPIDDVRGSAAYRLDAVEEMVRRMLGDLAKLGTAI
jgi:CO/xanthine dehydrogenase FAD-binding subunit